MPKQKYQFTSHSKLVFIAITLTLPAFALVVARKPLPSINTAQTQQPAIAAPTPSKLEVETIVLRSKGFEPKEITRPMGPFFLAVDTRIGASKADLVLNRLAGGQVREKKLPIGKRAWREQVDLPPGKYILTVVDRPTAICTITITPR